MVNGSVTNPKLAGVIPVSKGGTGATSGGAALSSLGLTILDAPGDYSGDDWYAISPKGVMDMLNEIYSTTVTGTGSHEFSSSSTVTLQVSGVANGITLGSTGITIIDSGNYYISVKMTASVTESVGFGRSATVECSYNVSSIGSIPVVSITSSSIASETDTDERTVYLDSGTTISFAASAVKNNQSSSGDNYLPAAASVVFTVSRRAAA